MSIFRKQDRLNWSLGANIYYNAHIDKVRKDIEAGADVNATYKGEYERRTMLYWAVDRGRADVAELLLQKGAAPEGDRASDTPLMRAVRLGKFDTVKVLLEGGATPNPDCNGSYREVPLLSAAQQGAGNIMQALVEKGANVNVKGSDGNTALHIVAGKGHANLVKYLLEHGADAKVANANMNTPADVAEKDFPRIADMIRGVVAPAETPVPKAEASWSLTEPDEVARVKDKPLIGYRVTEIFNFSARLYTQISQNLKTGAESQSVKGFAELGDGSAVEAAHAALVRLGGKVDTIDKVKLPSPGQGG